MESRSAQTFAFWSASVKDASDAGALVLHEHMRVRRSKHSRSLKPTRIFKQSQVSSSPPRSGLTTCRRLKMHLCKLKPKLKPTQKVRLTLRLAKLKAKLEAKLKVKLQAMIRQ